MGLIRDTLQGIKYALKNLTSRQPTIKSLELRHLKLSEKARKNDNDNPINTNKKRKKEIKRVNKLIKEGIQLKRSYLKTPPSRNRREYLEELNKLIKNMENHTLNIKFDIKYDELSKRVSKISSSINKFTDEANKIKQMLENNPENMENKNRLIGLTSSLANYIPILKGNSIESIYHNTYDLNKLKESSNPVLNNGPKSKKHKGVKKQKNITPKL